MPFPSHPAPAAFSPGREQGTQEARPPESALFAPDCVALGCFCGSFVCSTVVYWAPVVPDPVRDASAAEIKGVPLWCLGTHSLVGASACKQSVLLQCAGVVSKWSAVGLEEPKG